MIQTGTECHTQAVPISDRRIFERRYAPRFYDEELRQLQNELGVHEEDIRGRNLLIPSGETVELSAVTSATVVSLDLQTVDLDAFKRWIGVSDDLIEDGFFLPPTEVPTVSYSNLMEGGREDMTAEEWKSVERATHYYLFGHSALVRAFRPAIDRHFGPYAARLYAADRIEVEPGGTLTISGYPAVAMVRHLIIHQGGAFKLQAPVKLMVETLDRPLHF